MFDEVAGSNACNWLSKGHGYSVAVCTCTGSFIDENFRMRRCQFGLTLVVVVETRLSPTGTGDAIIEPPLLLIFNRLLWRHGLVKRSFVWVRWNLHASVKAWCRRWCHCFQGCCNTPCPYLACYFCFSAVTNTWRKTPFWAESQTLTLRDCYSSTLFRSFSQELCCGFLVLWSLRYRLWFTNFPLGYALRNTTRLFENKSKKKQQPLLKRRGMTLATVNATCTVRWNYNGRFTNNE